MSRFEVIVGNIGLAHDGNNRDYAKAMFRSYVKMSKLGWGRAAGEGVTLMEEGEPIMEHTGWLSMEMEDDQ